MFSGALIISDHWAGDYWLHTVASIPAIIFLRRPHKHGTEGWARWRVWQRCNGVIVRLRSVWGSGDDGAPHEEQEASRAGQDPGG